MKKEIFKLVTASEKLSLLEITVNISASAIIGLFICLSYAISHKGTIYSKKFNVSLCVLSVLTGTVMTVIGNNIALSLGMVGALSIVRFRTAIKDSRDTVYIFWAIIVGICCGVGDFFVGGIGSVVTFFVLLILGGIKNDNRMLLIIRANRNRQEQIQSKVFQFFNHKAILRVRNTDEENIEFIYEISQNILKKSEEANGDITNTLYALKGIDYVNVVMQNDEISN